MSKFRFFFPYTKLLETLTDKKENLVQEIKRITEDRDRGKGYSPTRQSAKYVESTDLILALCCAYNFMEDLEKCLVVNVFVLNSMIYYKISRGSICRWKRQVF